MSLEWAHVIFAGGGAVIGAVIGLITGVWRLAHIEQDIRKDFAEEIAAAVQEREEKLGELADQFDETLRALREKINSVELNTVKFFVPKVDLERFLDEYRHDMRDLKKSLAEMRRLP